MREAVPTIAKYVQNVYALDSNHKNMNVIDVVEVERAKKAAAEKAEEAAERAQSQREEREDTLAKAKKAQEEREKSKPTPEGIKAGREAKLTDPVKKRQVEIRNAGDLKAFAAEIDSELERNPHENPFAHTETGDLKQYYFAAALVSARLEKYGPLGQREAVPEYLRTYNRLLTEELSKRGINTTELFYESAIKVSQAGLEKGSIGAAPLTEDNFADVLQLENIVREINTEAERLGERQLSIEYFQAQRDRVQRLIDNGTIQPLRTQRALELINIINSRIDEEIERERVNNQRRDNDRIQREIDAGRARWETIIDRRTGRPERVLRELGLSHERMLLQKEKDDMRVAVDEIYEGANGVPEGYLQHEALDELFNRMFEYADQGLREDFREAFGIGSREKELFRQELSNMIDEYTKQMLSAPDNATRVMNRDKVAIVQKFIEKYDAEYTTRELLHNIFFIAETEREFEEFAKYIKNFQSGFADLAFFQSPEVEAALRVREQVLYELRRENDGYLPPELVTFSTGRGETEWEKRTREIMNELNDKGYFTPQGEAQGPVKEWKINRAMSLSRGLGMALLRFPEISAESSLRGPAQDYQVQSSIPWEKLAWDLNPLDHKIKRYNMGREVKAIFYAARKRTKKGLLNFWSQDELKAAIQQDAVMVLGSMGNDTRIVDMRNLFRTGGPFSHTGWRTYLAALKKDRSELKDSLKRNPGLAINMIFNRYEISGLGAERYNFYLENKDVPMDDDERAELWEQRVKELKAGGPLGLTGNEAWKRAEKESWIKSADRTPHVILRILLDEANVLLTKRERNAFIVRIENEMGCKITSDEFTKVEHALELAKEHLMKRRRDALVARRAFGDEDDKLTPEDFLQIDDEHVRERAEKLHRLISGEMRTNKKLLDNIFERVDGRMFPYAVTAQDIPWGEFTFGQTGARGFFTRKVNDAEEVAKADVEMEFLLKHLHEFKSPEEVVEQLKKIFYHAEIYDYERAQDAIKDLAIGIIRYYSKDGILKIPILGEIMSPINALLARGDSYAQSVGGGQAMAWDSDDIYAFTEQLRQIFKGEKEGRDIVEAIRRETGGTIFHAIGKKTKVAIYLLALFLSYEMINKLISEK